MKAAMVGHILLTKEEKVSLQAGAVMRDRRLSSSGRTTKITLARDHSLVPFLVCSEA